MLLSMNDILPVFYIYKFAVVFKYSTIQLYCLCVEKFAFWKGREIVMGNTAQLLLVNSKLRKYAKIS